MENIKNPKNQDDTDSDGISKNSHLSLDDSLIQSRSYICSFCIRGFSNAQALGGHMNIHRRDRAKLRQQLMDDNKDDVIAESESSEVVFLDLNEQQQEEKEKEEEAMACDDNQDQDMDEDTSHVDQKLGFWAQESKPDVNDHGKVMDGSSSSHHIEELDLELRLGQSATEKKKT